MTSQEFGGVRVGARDVTLPAGGTGSVARSRSDGV